MRAPVKSFRGHTTSVTRRHVERMVSGLARTQRNRVLALTSRVFRQFERWELRPQNTNPARGVERARETVRDRTLAPSELHALSRALDDMAGAYTASVAAIRFAAVTGLRIGEVLAIQWEHVDFEQSRLTMPATKTGRRQHDLPVPALDVLRGLARINGCPWAFTTTGKAALTYRPVYVHFGEAARAAGLADVRLHDLRRTVMTRAAAAGVGTHVLRDLLGHKTTAMADRYVRAVGSPVRDAREAVAAEMARAMATGHGDGAGVAVCLKNGFTLPDLSENGLDGGAPTNGFGSALWGQVVSTRFRMFACPRRCSTRRMPPSVIWRCHGLSGLPQFEIMIRSISSDG